MLDDVRRIDVYDLGLKRKFGGFKTRYKDNEYEVYRIYVPKDIVSELKWKKGDRLEFYIGEDREGNKFLLVCKKCAFR